MHYDICSLQKTIIQLCKEKNISINKLAQLSGLTQSTIDSILKGKSQNPKIATLHKISDGFEMDFQRFLSYIDSMQDLDNHLETNYYSYGPETEEDKKIVEFISNKIKRLRKDRSITLVQISQALNVDRFKENTISYHTLISLADYFDVSLDYLVGRTDDPARH